MRFLLSKFAPNLIDVARVGSFPSGNARLRAELMTNHRVSERRFLAEMLPKGGIGAEIGVFTGLFSATLLKRTQSHLIHFVDPWWEAFGETYPDWGIYTAYGRLSTREAYEAARRRIGRHAGNTMTDIHVASSAKFLRGLPDHYLDWAYIDSTHSYEGTRDELALLAPKLKPGGLIAGDDWHDKPEHHHAGVAQAVREAVDAGSYIMVGAYSALQWIIQSPPEPEALSATR